MRGARVDDRGWILLAVFGAAACGNDNPPSPAPRIEAFTADPIMVEPGQPTLLSYEVEHAEGISIRADPGALILQTSGLSGSVSSGALESSTRFTLTATSSRKPGARDRVTVLVPQARPSILRFESTQEFNGFAGAGETAVLTWETLGAGEIAVEKGGTEILRTTIESGANAVVLMPGENEFTLFASNGRGTSRSDLVVLGHEPPTIQTLDASPTVILEPQEVQVTWQTEGTSRLELFADGRPVAGFPGRRGLLPKVVDSAGTFPVEIAGTTTFVLRAATAGGTAEAEVTVTRRAPFAAKPGANQVYTTAVPMSGDPDRFAIDVNQPVYLEAETFGPSGPPVCSGIDSVVTLLDNQGNVLGSDDDGGSRACSRIDRNQSFARLEAGRYELQVTAPTQQGPVAYTLRVGAVETDVCGNGVPEWALEACDDGNLVSNDGCSATCESERFDALPGTGRLRTGLSIPANGQSVTRITVTSTILLSAETFTDAATKTCAPDVDTVMRLFDEIGIELGEDDDDGDRECSRFDLREDPFTRLEKPGDYALVVHEVAGRAIGTLDLELFAVDADVCGNGFVDANVGELCDDGNAMDGDDCTAACQPELSYTAHPGSSTTFSILVPRSVEVPIALVATSTTLVRVATFSDASTKACAGIDTGLRIRDERYEALGPDVGFVERCAELDWRDDARMLITPGDYVIELFEVGMDDEMALDVVLEATKPFCGDGFVLPGEICDDANDVLDDGCDEMCAFEITGEYSATSMNRKLFEDQEIAPGEIAVYEVVVPQGSTAGLVVDTYSDADSDTCDGIENILRLYDGEGRVLGATSISTRCGSIDAGRPNQEFAKLSSGTYYLSVEELRRDESMVFDVEFNVP